MSVTWRLAFATMLDPSHLEHWVQLANDKHTLSKTSPCIWWVLVWIATSTSICWGMFIEMITLVEGNTKWVLQNKHVIATLLVLVTCLLVMQLALAMLGLFYGHYYRLRPNFILLWMNAICLSWYLTCACECIQLALANARRDVWQRSTLICFGNVRK